MVVRKRKPYSCNENFLHLLRRALYRAIGAIDAAVSFLRLQQCMTIFTFVEKLAGIFRHGFDFLMSAMGTGD